MLINTVINGVYQSADKIGINREVINYGAKTQLLFIGECCLSITIAILINKTLNSVIFILTFTYLRSVCGGYHCKGYLSCTCLYVFIVISSIVICPHMDRLISIFLAIISWFLLFVISPVQNENNRLTSVESSKYKKIAQIRLFSVGCLFTLLYFLNFDIYAYLISLDLLWLSFLCFVQLLSERSEK